MASIPWQEHAGHGNLEKKTTREQPGKTPGTPREPPGTPREQKIDFCKLVGSRCLASFGFEDLQIEQICLFCAMAAPAELGSLFREIVQEWQGEHGKAPSPKEFAEVTGLTVGEAKDVLAEIAEEMPAPPKKPRRAASKVKRPAAAIDSIRTVGNGGWESDMEPDLPDTLPDEVQEVPPDNQLGELPDPEEGGHENEVPAADEMETQAAGELETPSRKAQENETALAAVPTSGLFRGETKRLGWFHFDSDILAMHWVCFSCQVHCDLA